MTEQTNTNPFPDSKSLSALKGTVSEPITTISHKPATTGEEVQVRLVESGAGMVGLENREDNKEWSGIFNHIVKTARVATFLAEELKKTGVQVDPSLVLNTILVSHAGRRQWDESNWYPDVIENAGEKAKGGDQKLATQVLKKAGISEEIMDIVDAHGIGTIYPIEKMDTWEKKLSLYADFRTSQTIMSLRERFEDMAKRAVPSGRVTQEQLDAIEKWAFATEQDIFSRLSIRPEDILEDMPPQPRWEHYIRRLYINDAEGGIFERISELHDKIDKGEISETELNKEFPSSTWWGNYVKELYDTRNGEPFHPRLGKQVGIARAIGFYSSLEKRSPQTT
jgi:hypothetical protein